MKKSHDQKSPWSTEESAKMQQTLQSVMDDEIIEKDIKEAMKDSRFQKTMDKILSLDKERYFLTLAQQGVRLLNDFDVNQLRNTTKTQGSSQQEPLIPDFLRQNTMP